MSSKTSDARVSEAILSCMGALQGLTNRETAMVLRAIAGMNNFIVQSPGQVANRGLAQSATARRAAADNAGRGASRPNPANKDPKVLGLKKELKLLQEKIRKEAASRKLDKLPADDALVKERDSLLTQIRSFRDQATPGSTAGPAEKGSVEGETAGGSSPQPSDSPREIPTELSKSLSTAKQ